MDARKAAVAQSDEQWEESPEAAATAAARSMLKDTHTCLPGIVKAYDPETQTASVQPAIRRVFVDQGEVDLPVCVDVPVVFPAGGDFVLTFPVAAGDECLLIFSERAIDFWWDRGGTQLPSEVRFHDLSDAFALVGVNSRPRFVANVNPEAVELRTRDGGTVIRMEDGKITSNVGGDIGSQAALNGNDWASWAHDLITQIKAITVPTAVGPSGLPLNSPAFDALDAQIDGLLSTTVFVK